MQRDSVLFKTMLQSTPYDFLEFRRRRCVQKRCVKKELDIPDVLHRRSREVIQNWLEFFILQVRYRLKTSWLETNEARGPLTYRE